MKKFNKESWGESYVRGSWFQDPNRLKKSKALMYCTDDQSKNFSLICYQTPGKARPYYAMSGSKEALVLFISRQVDIPWVELSLR
jgi:hypothetical protein